MATLAQSNESLQPLGDPLADDHIDFDAWLLPPAIPGRVGRATRMCSAAAGPLVFAAALAGVVRWLL